jgi:hypothetical protein
MEQSSKVGMTEAAQLLQALGICTAFGPTGKINGPNCQRFGHRDAAAGKWWWSVLELVDEARKRGVSEERIKGVIEHHHQSPTGIVHHPPRSVRNRAELEKEFRDSICSLESLLQKLVQSRDTFGKLIAKAEKLGLLARHGVAELSFINSIRIGLFHPGTDIDDKSLDRAIASIKDQIAALSENR